ncbi:hypothetical protein FRC12_024102 [Ceratobasidium sp. 428]|nr:hypothetical protein FRC12_024102 [Ceratobasidium sp. 428]
MPASIFMAEERQFITSYLPGWQQLAGLGKQRNAQGELHSPKDDFIDEVVGEFFDQFPERDLEHNQYNIPAKQKDFLDLLAELAAEAELARAAAKKPFAQQTSAMQDIILEDLPREISSAMQDWEYRTGAHLFIMGCWGGSDGSTSTFDYTTKGCQGFRKLQECEDAQVGWQRWMQKHFGPVLRRTVGEIEAEVYASEAGLPMLPSIAHLGLPIVCQKQIF